MTTRREILAVPGAGLLSAPLSTFPQPQTKVWRVGILSQRQFPEPPSSDVNVRAFVRGMRELGYVEGKNLVIELRSAEDTIPQSLLISADKVIE